MDKFRSVIATAVIGIITLSSCGTLGQDDVVERYHSQTFEIPGSNYQMVCLIFTHKDRLKPDSCNIIPVTSNNGVGG